MHPVYTKLYSRYRDQVRGVRQLAKEQTKLLHEAWSRKLSTCDYVSQLKEIYDAQGSSSSPQRLIEGLLESEVTEIAVHGSGVEGFVDPFVEISSTLVLLIKCGIGMLERMESRDGHTSDHTAKHIREIGDMAGLTTLFSILGSLFGDRVHDMLNRADKALGVKLVYQGFYDVICTTCRGYYSCHKALRHHWAETECLEKWSQDDMPNMPIRLLYSGRYLHESGKLIVNVDEMNEWAIRYATEKLEIDLSKREDDDVTTGGKKQQQKKWRGVTMDVEDEEEEGWRGIPKAELEQLFSEGAPFISLILCGIRVKVPTREIPYVALSYEQSG